MRAIVAHLSPNIIRLNRSNLSSLSCPLLCGNRWTHPLAHTTTRRQFSTQWASNPKVFPGFDLSLLNPGNDDLVKTYEPNPIHTYPVSDAEILKDRYQVISKIGYGPTATLWLGIDMGQVSKRCRQCINLTYLIERLSANLSR